MTILDEIDRIQEISAFIAKIEDITKKARVQKAFDIAIQNLHLLKGNFNTELPDPTFRIVRSNTRNAGAMPFLYIEISDSLIDHCFTAKYQTLDVVFSHGYPKNFDYEFMPQAMLAWVIAHETAHVYRRHDEVARIHTKSPLLVSQALENDADLLASAYVFRILQNSLDLDESDDSHLKKGGEIGIRQLALYCIFWALRTLVESGNVGTHLPVGARFFSIAQKFASLGVSPYTVQPGKLMTPAMKQRHLVLLNSIARFENLFLKANPNSAVDIRKDWTSHSQAVKNVERKWGHMRADIRRLSNGPA